RIAGHMPAEVARQHTHVDVVAAARAIRHADGEIVGLVEGRGILRRCGGDAYDRDGERDRDHVAHRICATGACNRIVYHPRFPFFRSYGASTDVVDALVTA